VHPNPARDEVTFDYDFAGKREPLVLAISTAGGRLVYSAQLSGTSGSLRWNARSAAPGVYLYKITSGNKPLQAGKISVVR
jgi:type IV secretory pathway protease TraF